MDSFLFSVNAVLPIVLMVLVGYLIKRIGLLDIKGAKLLNKIVFRLFLPVMLFLNVYKIERLAGFDFTYTLYGAGILILVFLVMIPVVIKVTPKERRGSLHQACFRANYALVGIPLAEALFGEAGVSVASMMSIMSVPMLNILGVISLTIFAPKEEQAEEGNEVAPTSEPSAPGLDVKKILLGIWKNPLIRAILLGIACLLVRELFIAFDVSFRLSDLTPCMKVAQSLANVATPLSLVALGAEFEFSAIKELKKEIIIGVMTKTVITPLLGLSIAVLLFPNAFYGAHYAAFVACFATPVSVSSLPMAQEMKAHAPLAGQLVVFSTIASAFTVFLAAFVLKSIGIF